MSCLPLRPLSRRLLAGAPILLTPRLASSFPALVASLPKTYQAKGKQTARFDFNCFFQTHNIIPITGSLRTDFLFPPKAT